MHLQLSLFSMIASCRREAMEERPSGANGRDEQSKRRPSAVRPVVATLLNQSRTWNEATYQNVRGSRTGMDPRRFSDDMRDDRVVAAPGGRVTWRDGNERTSYPSSTVHVTPPDPNSTPPRSFTHGDSYSTLVQPSQRWLAPSSARSYQSNTTQPWPTTSWREAGTSYRHTLSRGPHGTTSSTVQYDSQRHPTERAWQAGYGSHAVRPPQQSEEPRRSYYGYPSTQGTTSRQLTADSTKFVESRYLPTRRPPSEQNWYNARREGDVASSTSQQAQQQQSWPTRTYGKSGSYSSPLGVLPIVPRPYAPHQAATTLTFKRSSEQAELSPPELGSVPSDDAPSDEIPRKRLKTNDDESPKGDKPNMLDLLCSATLELGPLQENPTGCSCPRSACTKLYCDCFRAGVRCTEFCSCHKCKNTVAESGPDGERTRAIKTILARNPRAFTGGKKEAVPREPGDIVCNCVKSRCLKLYCACFQNKRTCNEACCCISCYNTTEESDEGGQRKLAMQQALQRRADAFAIKQKAIGSGCACKNNRCLKRYCDCFRAGMNCTEKCVCRQCGNAASV